MNTVRHSPLRSPPPPPISYSVTGAVQATGLSRTGLYALMGSKAITARKAGGRTIIDGDSLRSYMAGLPTADITTGRPSFPQSAAGAR